MSAGDTLVSVIKCYLLLFQSYFEQYKYLHNNIVYGTYIQIGGRRTDYNFVHNSRYSYYKVVNHRHLPR